MNYYVVRTIDHTMYHESRLFLMMLMMVIAIYFIWSRRDHRYIVIFLSGAIFQTVFELCNLYMGFRAPVYTITVLGAKLRDIHAAVFQGLTQGPVLAVLGLWFTDLVTSHRRRRETREAFVMVCAVVLGTSVVVGFNAQGMPVTSVRPLFGSYAVGMTLMFLGASAELAQLRDSGRRLLGWFFVGLVLYSLLHQMPLYLTGARFFIGDNAAQPNGAWQAGLLLWTHLIDASAGKLHYFAIPMCLGLADREDAGETAHVREHYVAAA